MKLTSFHRSIMITAFAAYLFPLLDGRNNTTNPRIQGVSIRPLLPLGGGGNRPQSDIERQKHYAVFGSEKWLQDRNKREKTYPK